MSEENKFLLENGLTVTTNTTAIRILSNFIKLITSAVPKYLVIKARSTVRIIGLDQNAWKIFFTPLKNIYKETKLKEFQFKLIHEIVVIKRSFIDVALKRTMNVSTVVRKIQFNRPFSKMAALNSKKLK